MNSLDLLEDPHSRLGLGQETHWVGHQRSVGNCRAGATESRAYPQARRSGRPGASRGRARSRSHSDGQPDEHGRRRRPAIGLGARIRRGHRKANGPAGPVLGRAPHQRGGGPRAARQRNQHREAGRGRGPSLRRDPFAKLPGLSSGMKAFSAIRMFAFLAVLAGGLAVYRLGRPYRGFGEETFVDVPHGTSTGTMARMLADAGVVRSRWDFLLARLAGRGRKLQAGEYRFDRAATPVEVYGRIARGDVFFYELVVPEGRNMFDIAASAEKLGLFPGDEFLAAARDPRAIRDLEPPPAPPPPPPGPLLRCVARKFAGGRAGSARQRGCARSGHAGLAGRKGRQARKRTSAHRRRVRDRKSVV